MRSDSDRDRTVRTGNAIFYSIFNKRLKDQAWNAGAHQFGRNIYAGDEAIRKPDGLDIQIELLQANLVRQRHIVQRIAGQRSEEHTSELQSLMRISYAVFCLKKKKINLHPPTHKCNLVYRTCHTDHPPTE